MKKIFFYSWRILALKSLIRIFQNKNSNQNPNKIFFYRYLQTYVGGMILVWNSVVWSRFFFNWVPKNKFARLGSSALQTDRPDKKLSTTFRCDTLCRYSRWEYRHTPPLRCDATKSIPVLSIWYRYSDNPATLYRLLAPMKAYFQIWKSAKLKKKNESVKQSQLLNTYRYRYQYIIVRAAAKFIFRTSQHSNLKVRQAKKKEWKR